MFTLQTVLDLLQRQEVEPEEVELTRSEFRSLAARIAMPSGLSRRRPISPGSQGHFVSRYLLRFTTS